MPHTAALVVSLVASATALSAPTSAPKAALYNAIDKFNAATAIDGTVPIDFGVKGGELDKKSRAAPRCAALRCRLSKKRARECSTRY